MTDQMRPSFPDFDAAIAHLQSLKKRWAKEVAFHKRAARLRK